MSNGEANWRESASDCPKCESVLLIGDWWDDPPEMGGACIGSLFKCSNSDCDYTDRV